MPTVASETVSLLYGKLLDHSNKESINGEELIVFRGSMMAVADQLGMSRTNYAKAIRLLKANECLQVVEKGTRGYESVVVLHRPPTAEDAIDRGTLTNPNQPARLSRRTDAVERLLGGVDVVRALSDIEQRLTAIESQLGITAPSHDTH